MKITICSRLQIEKLIREGFPDKTAVISFYDPETSRFIAEDYRPVDYKEKTDRLFRIPLYDIDLSVLPEYGLTYETYFPEADALAEFIHSAKTDGYDIICQCEYGESRSSGCAAAILEYFYKNGISVFADYRYYPNQVVYHKVLEALRSSLKPVKGVFWIVEGRLLAIPFDHAHPYGLAKSGDTYVHKKIWEYVRPKGCKKTYNYYPRGRVETKNNGSAVVYMNPNIGEGYIKAIMEIYRLSEYPSIKYDYSKHYKCYLDVGWKAEGRR